MRTPVTPVTPAPGERFLCLAPMDGVTDVTYRDVITELNAGPAAVDLCVSEFVRVTRQAVMPHVILRHCPELESGGVTRSGVPVFVQLLGGEPEFMAEAARVAEGLGALGVDLNFGCPAKTVNGSDGGAVLLKDARRVERVTKAVRGAVSDMVPVTVKIRTGWADASSIEAIARAAEAGGAAWLTVHGRTREQLYRPPVDWDAIGRARRAIEIPVVANGDLVDQASLDACARRTGCTAFMVGRGAMAHPNIFAMLRGQATALDAGSLHRLLVRYARNMVERGVQPSRALGRVKQWLRMGAGAGAMRPELARSFEVLKRERDLEAVLACLDRMATDQAA